MARKRTERPRAPNRQVRIIGGEWRGRRLTVADREGLRPTPDRVRETLFNWLAADLPGSRVLDAFAGAGALGFEAASRGAACVTLVERDVRTAETLRNQARELASPPRLQVVAGDVLCWLRDYTGSPFDVVFIDPPYAHPELRRGLLETLIQERRLSAEALIYLEWPKRDQDPLSSLEMKGVSNMKLTWIKRKHAGEVAFGLARRVPSG